MSRAIRLTRIHAINWYGYNDSFPVEGHLLLAGVTGSGKSVLMDLIQLVLVGSDHALFNRSATGSTGDRTLKSYCLLDTKREENGVPQYVRDKGAITYIALEFTWPASDRVETWGIRFEFRNAAENQGRQPMPFFCDGSLAKSDFLDAERRPLEAVAFKHLIEKQRDGQIFETQEKYLRDMANDRHLNFNPAVLGVLLPTAMSFTSQRSFDDFCRRFILPGGKLNVDDVVASYKSFLAYERDLADLRDQLERLNAIHELHNRHIHAVRDRVVARWLAAKLALEHAEVSETEQRRQLAALEAAYADEKKQLAELDERIELRTSELNRLLAAINETPEGRLYTELKEQVRKLTIEISKLSEVGTRLDTALRARVKNARVWLAEAESAPLDTPAEAATLAGAITHLESCAAEETDDALKDVIKAAKAMSEALGRGIRPARSELQDTREKLGRVRDQIVSLERGIPPVPTPLLNALNAALSPDGRAPAACSLRDLCEVNDETWRPAIEVAFTRKFAVVVSKENYDLALKVYQELGPDRLRGETPESLVNPNRAHMRDVKPGSLAEKLSMEHPVARAIVSQLFGDLMCVTQREALAKHERAILADGFMSAGAFVERRRYYDGLPFVGREGLKKQLQLKRADERELDAKERQLRPRVERVDEIVRSQAEMVPDHGSLLRDLIEAQRLPTLKVQQQEAIGKLNQIDRASFDQKEAEAQAKEAELDGWKGTQRELLQSGKKTTVQTAKAGLEAQQKELDSARLAFDRVSDASGDISVHATRLNEWRVEVVTAFPALDAASQQFEKLEAEADKLADTSWEQLKSAREKLVLAYSKFSDLSPIEPTNGPWDKLRTQIGEANIPDYQAKSAAARKEWENLFRNQVLSRLDRALRDVRDIVFLLNGHLKKQPIGNDYYEIKSTPNPEFKVYRELVSMNAQSQQDDLFFASVDGEMRAALDHFLDVLVKEPDSTEATRLLDYRHYNDYDLLVWNALDPEDKPQSVDRQSRKFSGGEHQSPYFVAILASYLRAYNRHETRWREPSLALVPIDEAFSKLSTERIADCMKAIKDLDLQSVLSMSEGNIPGAFTQCDQILIVSKHEERRGNRRHIRNISENILRDSEEGREWMIKHA